MLCFSLHCSLFFAQRNTSSSVIARRHFGCLCNVVASALGLCSCDCERRFLWPLFAPFFGMMSHVCSRKPQSTAADVTLIILGAVLTLCSWNSRRLVWQCSDTVTSPCSDPGPHTSCVSEVSDGSDTYTMVATSC